ncbi:preprotein translocase subunit SecE [Candidatus Finniella inopinata]|uniref:Protein translocase subunit SecE n=1 Tax=Candidatus Finniella inopinata TaxID=1696036 RepID=A0A4Q7DJL7_9PROT|nr:preprotein translocase subunit SecE [Candidatus Finniella inopinata]RZI46234.1 preprotein translocase subunit SecE [Candidatus Finniella inopinata]
MGSTPSTPAKVILCANIQTARNKKIEVTLKTTAKNKNFLKKAPQFIGEVREEASKVTWPSRKETSLTTTIVFVFAIIAAIYFMIVDQIIYRALHWIIG